MLNGQQLGAAAAQQHRRERHGVDLALTTCIIRASDILGYVEVKCNHVDVVANQSGSTSEATQSLVSDVCSPISFTVYRRPKLSGSIVHRKRPFKH